MLIPFGVFSAAGAGGGAAAGAYELISTAFGTGSSGTITFSSIPSTYKHLQIRLVSRTTSNNSGSYGSLNFRFNSDSASNYSEHILMGDGSSVQSYANANTTRLGYLLMGENSNPNIMPGIIIDILDYASTSKNKTIRAFEGVTGIGNRVDLTSSAWRSTSAVSTITITTDSFGNFSTTSRFSLYGIRG